MASQQFHGLRNSVRRASRANKAAHIDKLAAEADKAAAHGDNRHLYKLAKNLCKYNPPSIKTVHDAQGIPTKSADEYDARWLQHFQTVYGANLVAKISDIGTVEPGCPFHFQMPCPPIEVIERALASLASSKAVGPDGLPVEFLRAAGKPFLNIYYHIFRCIWYKAYVPLMWRGGRLSELFKKGSTLDCDNYRGLLISDHMSKVFTKVLDSYVHPYYLSYMPDVQCGAVPKKGTDFATHLVRSVIDYAALRGISVAIVFIDLIKAFDFALRELTVGWPQRDIPSRISHLRRLGLSSDRAAVVANDIVSNGCILKQLQAHPHIIEMMSSLHTGSWFKFGSATDVLAVEKGGRQGCIFGGKLFNFAYAKVLREVRARLAKEGIILHVSYRPNMPPWNTNRTPSNSSTPVIDIVFVDDTAAFVFAASPGTLTQHVHTAVGVFYDVLRGYLMTMNFKKGKTEVMIKFRGKGARDAKENLRASLGVEGSSVLPVILAHNGSAEAVDLVVCEEYKHLGSIVSVDGLLLHEAHARVRAAMASFAPLAVAVLGARSIDLTRRLRLGWSLFFHGCVLICTYGHIFLTLLGGSSTVCTIDYGDVYMDSLAFVALTART